MKAFTQALAAVLVFGIVVAGITAYAIARKGLSAREEPSAVEAFAARSMRGLATPSDVRGRSNPVVPTAAVTREALEHFADHCAACHANDGSGNTSMGRNLYPPAPDMRAMATQSLTDGELFSIIENGIRLTGMPAWGTRTPEGERASWALVHFIRQLPTLSATDVEHMETLNPRTPAEFREQEAARRFLAGEDAPATHAAPASAGHTH